MLYQMKLFVMKILYLVFSLLHMDLVAKERYLVRNIEAKPAKV
jgi:hypothetical protein